MATDTLTVSTASAEETRQLGAKLAAIARPGDVFSLDGGLGCGKTELVRGFVDALISGAPVRSPTFSIVNAYRSPKFPIYHFDFYRIEDARELSAIGLEEYLCGDGVCLIEWGELFPQALPEGTRHIRFTEVGETTREIALP
jgi:tRNA threonylcarbamoyladenosine biosynthesis protein TsaE